MDNLIKELEAIAEIDRQNEEIEMEKAKELTTREWDLIYDAVERRICALEDLMLEFGDEKRIKMVLEKIEELDVIMNKVGPKTI